MKNDIDEAYVEFGLGEKTRVGRRLYFYFAGHGLAPNFDEVALLMANASRQLLGSNLGVHKYRRFLRNAAPFDEVVFILDCCRDFEDRAEPQGPEFTLRLNEDRAPLVQDYLVMAAEYGRKAFEPEETKSGDRRGLLTKALLEGLRDPQRKAVDRDGKITAASLSAYIKQRVPELAKNARLNQTPEIPAAPEKLVFATVSQPTFKHRRMRVTAAAGLGGELVLVDGLDREIERRPAEQTPWERSLDPGLYALSHTLSHQEYLIDARKPKEEVDVYHFS